MRKGVRGEREGECGENEGERVEGVRDWEGAS